MIKLIIIFSLLIFSCTNVETPKKENKLNLIKECSICHLMPDFNHVKEKEIIEVLKEHKKLRRINFTEDKFLILTKEILNKIK